VPPVTIAALKGAVEYQLDNVTDVVVSIVNTVVEAATTLVGSVDEALGQGRRSSHDRRMEEMSAWLNTAPPKDAYPLLDGVGISYCP
jgi:hypothetical protein